MKFYVLLRSKPALNLKIVKIKKRMSDCFLCLIDYVNTFKFEDKHLGMLLWDEHITKNDEEDKQNTSPTKYLTNLTNLFSDALRSGHACFGVLPFDNKHQWTDESIEKFQSQMSEKFTVLNTTKVLRRSPGTVDNEGTACVSFQHKTLGFQIFVKLLKRIDREHLGIFLVDNEGFLLNAKNHKVVKVFTYKFLKNSTLLKSRTRGLSVKPIKTGKRKRKQKE